MIHSEEYYHPDGVCAKCGKDAGSMTPLKIMDDVNGEHCP